jgi:hypothetical protein
MKSNKKTKTDSATFFFPLPFHFFYSSIFHLSFFLSHFITFIITLKNIYSLSMTEKEARDGEKKINREPLPFIPWIFFITIIISISVYFYLRGNTIESRFPDVKEALKVFWLMPRDVLLKKYNQGLPVNYKEQVLIHREIEYLKYYFQEIRLKKLGALQYLLFYVPTTNVLFTTNDTKENFNQNVDMVSIWDIESIQQHRRPKNETILSIIQDLTRNSSLLSDFTQYSKLWEKKMTLTEYDISETIRLMWNSSSTSHVPSVAGIISMLAAREVYKFVPKY